MAEVHRSTANLVQRHSANTSDRLVILSDPSGNGSATATIAIGDLYGANSVGSAISISTPANSTAIVVKSGNFLYDGNNLYLATANNIVKRVGALTVF
jgi:hypothetical protein